MRQHFDPVDIVTEVVNRADHALDLAMVEGVGQGCLSGAAVGRSRCRRRNSFTAETQSAEKTPRCFNLETLKPCNLETLLFLLNSPVGLWPAISS